MSVVFRNVTRTILDSTETTSYTRTPAADPLTFELTTLSNFYIGFKKPFTTRYFHFSTLNTNVVTVTAEYWNGTTWQAVEDLIDQTNGMTRNGFLSWQNVGDWKEQELTPVDDRELFWIRVKVSDTLDGGTALQSLLNLFCDENLVRAYYPELIDDSRYLPPGRVDFVEQLEAAKNLVVLRLKQDHLIRDESQIIDINEVALSAVHAFAWVVLNPIAVDEGEKERRDKAFTDFNYELNKVKLDLDFDDTGIVEADEENQGNIFFKRI